MPMFLSTSITRTGLYGDLVEKEPENEIVLGKRLCMKKITYIFIPDRMVYGRDDSCSQLLQVLTRDGSRSSAM